MIGITQMEYFCTTVEMQGITRAARALMVTQPAVSLQIRKLEEKLDVQLFKRVGNKLQLTDAGETFYRHASAIVEMHRRIQDAMEEYSRGVKGKIVLGVSTTGFYLIQDAIKEYRRAMPNIDIVLRPGITDHIRQDVARQLIDIGAVWAPVIDNRLVQKPVAVDEYVVIASPEHPIAQQEAISPHELADTPLLLLPEGTETRKFIEGRLREAGIRPSKIHELPTSDWIRRAVECNLGVAVASYNLTRREIEAGTIKALQIRGFNLSRQLILIHKPKDKLSPAVQNFITFMEQQVVFARGGDKYLLGT